MKIVEAHARSSWQLWLLIFQFFRCHFSEISTGLTILTKSNPALNRNTFQKPEGLDKPRGALTYRRSLRLFIMRETRSAKCSVETICVKWWAELIVGFVPVLRRTENVIRQQKRQHGAIKQTLPSMWSIISISYYMFRLPKNTVTPSSCPSSTSERFSPLSVWLLRVEKTLQKKS